MIIFSREKLELNKQLRGTWWYKVMFRMGPRKQGPALTIKKVGEIWGHDIGWACPKCVQTHDLGHMQLPNTGIFKTNLECACGFKDMVLLDGWKIPKIHIRDKDCIDETKSEITEERDAVRANPESDGRSDTDRKTRYGDAAVSAVANNEESSD